MHIAVVVAVPAAKTVPTEAVGYLRTVASAEPVTSWRTIARNVILARIVM